MIEAVILDFLNEKLSVPAYMEHPGKGIEKFVLVEKTGGSERNQVPSSTFAFQSYAPSLFEAAKLNGELKDVVKAMVERDEMAGIHLNSDYNYTDTATKEYRYQAVFDINHY